MGLDLTGLGAGFSFLSGVLDRVLPDKAAAAAAKLQLLQLTQSGDLARLQAETQVELAQIGTNTAEAARSSVNFRDGAGWVCVAAFALAALKSPIEWGCALAGHPVTLPAVDTGVTTDMLMGLLGLGSMHVYQQTKGK